MRIEMNRKVEVVAYEVLATLAFPEDRTEVLSLLQMAEEFGSLTGDQVVDRRSGLLPGRPRVMGKRLLNMAADLDLLELGHGGRFNLTEYGHETLENEIVFVPEEASWTIWVTRILSSQPRFSMSRGTEKEGLTEIDEVSSPCRRSLRTSPTRTST